MANRYKRGKIWWGRVQRKVQNQSREYRRSLKTKDGDVAERRLRAWIAELDATGWGDKPRRSYAEAEARFISEHLPAIKLSSAKRYGYSLKILIEHLAGKMLHEIGSATLMEIESRVRADGLKPGTIRRELQ